MSNFIPVDKMEVTADNGDVVVEFSDVKMRLTPKMAIAFALRLKQAATKAESGISAMKQVKALMLQHGHEVCAVLGSETAMMELLDKAEWEIRDEERRRNWGGAVND